MTIVLVPGLAWAQHHDHGGGAAAAAPAESRVYSTDGQVVEIDLANDRVVVNHGAIPQVGWEAMTMGFTAEDPSLLEGLAVGDKVRLDIRFDVGPAGPSYALVDLEKM
ncbi:MAG: copper-binding protein [Deltaproteobacteria bacterium]|nr:copper-binding protein [Deltaproteobacteria bacterium]